MNGVESHIRHTWYTFLLKSQLCALSEGLNVETSKVQQEDIVNSALMWTTRSIGKPYEQPVLE